MMGWHVIYQYSVYISYKIKIIIIIHIYELISY